MSEKLSFYQYAGKYNTQIPIIQRDYAQGREGKKAQAVLTNFLHAIETSLDKDETLSLNFIYGIEEKDDVFLPIDGQQRLTTLYLLHWFVALRTKHLEDFFNNTLNFSYQTRSSAIEFFKAIRPSPDDEKGRERIKELYKIESGDDIENFPWFKLDWSYDQTISGAINALKRMFKLFGTKNLDNWWEKLVSDQKCKIKFFYIAINKSINNKGNELENETKAAITYIKMNARGKNLSDFDNAKALIHSLNIKEGEEFVINFDNEYIKIIEKKAGDSEKKDIGKISKIIDEMMMQLLINLFNDLRYLFNELLSDESLSKSAEIDYLGYMAELRDFHENPDKEKEIFYNRYFDILNRLFNSELINTGEFAEYIKSDSRPVRLDFCLLLSYFYHNGYNLKGINEWKHLLKNLHYKDSDNTRDKYYSETISSLNTLSEDIKNKNVNGSPLLYISKEPESPEFIDISSVKAGDWKEEHIKSKILCAEELSFDEFNEIEENFDRRIRAFLFMSDFWNGSGKKTKLDLYIKLTIALKLKSNETIPMELRKLFYLFADSYNGTTKSKFRPYINSDIFNWNEPDEKAQEKLSILSSVYEYIESYHLNSFELLKEKINIIANDLYNKKDWSSFILARDYDELFYHLDSDLLSVSNNEKLNIFSYVKQLDLDGKPIREEINIKQTKYFGIIGENDWSKRYIRYENIINIYIKLTGENVSDYKFFKYDNNNDNIIRIYRYIEYCENKHLFEVLEFDISEDLIKYKDFSERIKVKFSGLSKEEITKHIRYREYPILKDYCKAICGEAIEVWCNNNTIFTQFKINIPVNLGGTNIKKETETLDLYRI